MTPERDAYHELGKALNQHRFDQLATQLSVFQSALINFALEYGSTIREDMHFRHKFTQMCVLIGVDPLELLVLIDSMSRSSKENLIGLGVRVVEICRYTRTINGGLISLKELHSRLQESVSVPLVVSEDDIRMALDSLALLGKGYDIVMINNKPWVKFLGIIGTTTISYDQKKVYELCEFMGGFVTYRLLKDNLGWDKVRSTSIVDEMIMNGFLWVDTQGLGGVTQFWEPSWISKS